MELKEGMPVWAKVDLETENGEKLASVLDKVEIFNSSKYGVSVTNGEYICNFSIREFNDNFTATPPNGESEIKPLVGNPSTGTSQKESPVFKSLEEIKDEVAEETKIPNFGTNFTDWSQVESIALTQHKIELLRISNERYATQYREEYDKSKIDGSAILPYAKENKITRDQFMEFFRNENFHSKISPDDCDEIFRTVLPSGSDITAKLLNSILLDYDVKNLTVIETPNFDNEHDL